MTIVADGRQALVLAVAVLVDRADEAVEALADADQFGDFEGLSVDLLGALVEHLFEIADAGALDADAFEEVIEIALRMIDDTHHQAVACPEFSGQPLEFEHARRFVGGFQSPLHFAIGDLVDADAGRNADVGLLVVSDVLMLVFKEPDKGTDGGLDVTLALQAVGALDLLHLGELCGVIAGVGRAFGRGALRRLARRALLGSRLLFVLWLGTAATAVATAAIAAAAAVARRGLRFTAVGCAGRLVDQCLADP